jgi:phage terminase large subunit-like protein
LDVEDWLILNFTLEEARERIAAGAANRKWFNLDPPMSSGL